MYAIIQVAASQFKVCEGDCIVVPQLSEEAGKTITLGEVLAFSDGKEVKIGQPHLKEIKVSAEVLRHHKGPKLISFKYKRRKNRSCKKGLRRALTSLKIKKISQK